MCEFQQKAATFLMLFETKEFGKELSGKLQRLEGALQ